MANIASRRIKGREAARPPKEKFASAEDIGGYLWTAVLVSIVLHAAVLGIIWHKPARKITKVVEIFNVTVTTLPGPAGGGGKSQEQLKSTKPVKEEPKIKEEVKVAKKQVEKKQPEAKKKPEPEKPEVAKVAPQAPIGPGQGPAGGGGKTKPGPLTGPVAIQGNFDPKYQWYADAIQKAVERNWNQPVLWGKKAKPAIVSFIIDGSGSVTEIKIETSSGIELYDQKALLAVKMVRKLQPPPAGLGDALGVHYSFIPGKQG